MKQNINKSQGYRKHQSILFYTHIFRGVGEYVFPFTPKNCQCWKKVKKSNFDNSCSVEKALWEVHLHHLQVYTHTKHQKVTIKLPEPKLKGID